MTVQVLGGFELGSHRQRLDADHSALGGATNGARLLKGRQSYTAPYLSYSVGLCRTAGLR